jgi:DnaJ family protein C protein 19
MFWLLLGAALLIVLLLALRAFERASVTSIRIFMTWLAAFGGIGLALLLLLSGRGAQALGGLVMVGPLLWRRWHRGTGLGGGAGFAGFTGGTGTSPPRQSSGTMSREEALEILGLKPGASDEDIHAAHRRLMRSMHPDTGGSDWLASRINQARDILLG